MASVETLMNYHLEQRRTLNEKINSLKDERGILRISCLDGKLKFQLELFETKRRLIELDKVLTVFCEDVDISELMNLIN